MKDLMATEDGETDGGYGASQVQLGIDYQYQGPPGGGVFLFAVFRGSSQIRCSQQLCKELQQRSAAPTIALHGVSESPLRDVLVLWEFTGV